MAMITWVTHKRVPGTAGLILREEPNNPRRVVVFEDGGVTTCNASQLNKIENRSPTVAQLGAMREYRNDILAEADGLELVASSIQSYLDRHPIGKERQFPVGGSKQAVADHLRSLGFELSSGLGDKAWYLSTDKTLEVHIYGTGSRARVCSIQPDSKRVQIADVLMDDLDATLKNIKEAKREHRG